MVGFPLRLSTCIVFSGHFHFWVRYAIHAHIVRALPDSWWNRQKLNPHNSSYELDALTSCATVPYKIVPSLSLTVSEADSVPNRRNAGMSNPVATTARYEPATSAPILLRRSALSYVVIMVEQM